MLWPPSWRAQLPLWLAPCPGGLWPFRHPRPPKGLFCWERARGWLLYFIRLFMALPPLPLPLPTLLPPPLGGAAESLWWGGVAAGS